MADGSGNEYRNEAMELPDSFSSSEKNLLSALFLVNEDDSMVAEIGARLNVIHLYSIDEDFCRTVSVGRRLENIRDMERLSPEEMLKSYYEAKSFAGYFAALYLNTTIEDIDSGLLGLPQLHFFRWDGTPLACIHLPVQTFYFDIDIISGQLYVVESDTEQILRYDVSDIIESITDNL